MSIIDGAACGGRSSHHGLTHTAQHPSLALPMPQLCCEHATTIYHKHRACCAASAVNAIIHQVHLLDPERAGQPQRLQTEGINFPGLWEQQQLLDVNM